MGINPIAHLLGGGILFYGKFASSVLLFSGQGWVWKSILYMT